jgi:hypothetical protein
VKKKKTPTLAENGSPNSTLFVNTHTAGKVCAVIDKDGDSAADEVIIRAQGLTCLKEQLFGMETSMWLKYTAAFTAKGTDFPENNYLSSGHQYPA